MGGDKAVSEGTPQGGAVSPLLSNCDSHFNAFAGVAGLPGSAVVAGRWVFLDGNLWNVYRFPHLPSSADG